MRDAPRIHRAALVMATVAGLTALGACGGGEPVLDAQATRGSQIAKSRGCTSCHTASGAISEGPTWKGLAGSQVQLTTGQTVTADDAYLKRSINEPRAQVVQGYRAMQLTNPLLTEAELNDVVAYINALK